MISKTKMNRRTVFQSGSAGAAWARGVLPTFLLALLGTGCGERFELGAVGQNLDQGEDGELSLPLLADGVEDADAPVENGSLDPLGTGFDPRGVGDVDGDGLDDWLAGGCLRYGRSRDPDGILATPESDGLSIVWDDLEEGLSRHLFTRLARAGDVNGDGYDDIVFSTTFGTNGALYDGHEIEAQRFAEQPAFLWYGGPDRTRGESALDEVAVVFPTREDLPGLFESELTDPSGDEVILQANQRVAFRALGDIDGDGYDDLAWTVQWNASREQQCTPDGICGVRTHERESVTYVFYGSADLLTSKAAPAARLPDVSELRAIGDVNGDGFADMQAMAGATFRALAGSAERLAGELVIDEMGVPMVGASQHFPAERIGDIDKDGHDDLIVVWEADGESARSYLFYGSPSLLAGPLEKGAANAMFAVHGPIAHLEPVGDWNGDGATDILLTHARIITDQFSPLAGSEVRLIPGSAERYSGEHHISVHRPDATIDGENIVGVAIAGDIDGDGFADLFIQGAGPDGDLDPKFVKYGGPLPPTPIY